MKQAMTERDVEVTIVEGHVVRRCLDERERIEARMRRERVACLRHHRCAQVSAHDGVCKGKRDGGHATRAAGTVEDATRCSEALERTTHDRALASIGEPPRP